MFEAYIDADTWVVIERMNIIGDALNRVIPGDNQAASTLLAVALRGAN